MHDEGRGARAQAARIEFCSSRDSPEMSSPLRFTPSPFITVLTSQSFRLLGACCLPHRTPVLLDAFLRFSLVVNHHTPLRKVAHVQILRANVVAVFVDDDVLGVVLPSAGRRPGEDQHFLLTIAARAAPQQNNQKSRLDNSYIYREESDLAIRLARGAV